MGNICSGTCDRRTFVRCLGGMALFCGLGSYDLFAGETGAAGGIGVTCRPPTLFAGIRKPIRERAELEPRIEQLRRVCRKRVDGPLTHIFRFDTPVEGYDSEIGFPVSAPVDAGDVRTHTLRRMWFYSTTHHGPMESAGETRGKLYDYMNRTGLSPELELAEVFHLREPKNPEESRTEILASFLAWPEVYREQLDRVLGPERAAPIWSGGESLTHHTPVDRRWPWVAATIRRLKKETTAEQQFDILSRVALVRPLEDVEKYRKIFIQSKDINTVIAAQHKALAQTRTGGFVDPPRFDGKVLHMSKVPYNGEAWEKAKTGEEKRKAYCFCNLVREATDPKIDPIFCYRAAGWARQFWEPILGVEFKRCEITHSILKGDDFCAWDYHLETTPA